jgi:hypothetical protein
LLNVLDERMADDLQPLYSIEISLGRSPKKGVKCGAIVIFKLNSVDLNLDKTFDPTVYDPSVVERAQEIQDEVSKQTEVMWCDPIYFKETEGRWIEWAVNKALELFDKAPISGNAKLSMKCPQLRVNVFRSRKEVTKLRGSHRKLFPVAADVDRLLSGGYSYDPWTKKIRRGRISAEMSKR